MLRTPQAFWAQNVCASSMSMASWSLSRISTFWAISAAERPFEVFLKSA